MTSREDRDADETPSAILIGDDVALGLSYMIDEAALIAQENMTASGLRNMLSSSSVWRNFRNDPWMVICIGTNDGTTNTYEALNAFRKRLEYAGTSSHNFRNPYVVWVAVIQNNYQNNIIKRIAKIYGDKVFDVPSFVSSTTKTATQKDIYYPYPWSKIFNSPPTVWYKKTVYSTSTTKKMLTDDNKFPNEAGYNYMAEGLRKVTNKWAVKKLKNRYHPDYYESNGDVNEKYCGTRGNERGESRW